MPTNTAIRSKDVCKLTVELQAMEIKWVHHPSFEFPNSVHHILESVADEPAPPPLSRTHFDMSIPQVDLLAPEEERTLFRRLNCLRYLAAKRRNQALENGPRPVDVRTVKNLLADADAVRDRISHANQRLLLKIASGFRSNRDDQQDLIGEAAVILLKAIDGFDVSRGFRFSTYATHAVQRHLSRVWKRNINRKLVTNGDEFQALQADDEEQWVDAELESMLPSLMRDLSKRERELVEMRFGLGRHKKAWTYREISKAIELSPERVRQIVLNACGKLRRKYAGSIGLDP